MRTRKQVISEFRQAEIVLAARSVFARRSYSDAIMDEIAKEAGVAKGTLYLYFKSKKEIYKAVLDHDMRALKSDTLDRMAAATTLRDKIHAFALTRIQSAEEHKDFFRILDSESGAPTYTRSQYRGWLREPVQHLGEAIEKASAAGEIRSFNAEKVAWLIADMTRGTIQRRLLNQGNAHPAEDAQFLVEFIWPAIAKS
jgi:TetR/AcrR family fatty acid metabolism transcriptional regulator